MNYEIDVFKCLDFLRDDSVKYANAKANRIRIEEFRKSKKAILMKEAEASDPVKYKSSAAQETYAYSHPDYIELINGLPAAVSVEEEYRYKLEGARLKIEVWRSQQANARLEAKVI